MKSILLTLISLLLSLCLAAQPTINNNKTVSRIITVKPKEDSKNLFMKNYEFIRSNFLGFFDVLTPEGKTVDDYIDELKHTNIFESIDYNTIISFDQLPTRETIYANVESLILNERNTTSSNFPNDPDFSNQSYLALINANDAWNLSTGDSTIKVAIINTGIDCTHNDIGIGNDTYSNVNLSLGENSTPYFSYGTQIAGLICAKTNNGLGIAGLAGGNNGRGVTIIPFNAIDAMNDYQIDGSLIDDYILEAVNIGARIIQIDFNSNMTSALEASINYAYNNGVTIVCGTGMDMSVAQNATAVKSPASNNRVIGVGCCTGTSNPSRYFSCYGEGIDLVAPGVLLYTTTLNNSYSHLHIGTDLAASLVTGTISLMLSINPNLTPDQIRTILHNTAYKIPLYSSCYNNNGWCDEVGYGLLDAYAAVDMAQYYISGNDTLCQSDVFQTMALPSGATVTWTLSGSNASKFNLVQNSPSANKCTITKKANAVFNSSSFTLTLTAKIYQGGTLVKTKTKTLTCNNGFACTYWQDAHEYYGVNYPAITQTQMTSATNYVYPGGIVYLQSEYFRGKVITTSGIFENFQYVGQNTVKFSLPPYSSSPAYINVAADGCDEALQLTFYPMTYYAMSGYSAQMSAIGSQEYRISLVSNERSSSDEEVSFTEDVATTMDADNPVSWTVEAINAMTGRKILSTEPKGTDYVLNTSNWESGLYVIRAIVAGEPIFAGKVTK